MKLRNVSLLPLAGIALALLTVTNSAEAVLIGVNTRAGIGGTDFVDWGILGPEFTTPSNPFVTLSNQGFTTTVSKSSLGNFERVDEGGFGWTGNFSAGDALLWTSLTPGPITIDLGILSSGGGVQIQNDFLGAFTATVEAFDAGGISLGSFNFNGTSTHAGDGSAIFVGVRSDALNIRKLSFDIQGSSSLAINRLDINRTITSGVPEAGNTLLLLGGACALIMAMAARQRRNTAAIRG